MHETVCNHIPLATCTNHCNQLLIYMYTYILISFCHSLDLQIQFQDIIIILYFSQAYDWSIGVT